MKSETRKKLLDTILSKLADEMMPIEIGGHTITNQLVFAGCSQWCGQGRDWDESRSDLAWIVDGQFQLTFPRLAYFDGRNQIERASDYYLQPDRSESPPREPIGQPLQEVPDKILVAIAKGLSDAIRLFNAQQCAEEQESQTLIATLGGVDL